MDSRQSIIPVLTTLVYLEKDHRYLMLHRTVKKNDVNKDKWIGVGGKFEDNESPDDCLLREVKEETGLTLTSFRMRGVVTFLSGRGDFEYMFLYTADRWEGELRPCDEGVLEWVDIDKVWDLNLWEGDKIFFRLIDEDAPFFSLKLVYDGTDKLRKAVLNGQEMELFDIINLDGSKTGVVKERGVAHRDGSRHPTVHMWVIRPNEKSGWDLLIQKRSANKDSNPGCWDISSAGHMQAGSEPMESAIREIGEELGIKARTEDLTYIGMHKGSFESTFYGRPFRDAENAYCYLYTKPVNIGDLTLQKEEVECVKWIDFRELVQGVKDGSLPNCIYLDELELIAGKLNISF